MNLKGLIAKKNGQSQAFLEDGTRIPVSMLVASNNIVTQVKTSEKEGYNSVQLGFDIKKKPNKAILGHSKKAGIEKTPRFFREIRVDDSVELNPGTIVNVSEIFEPGDIVDVTGVSKGKGFAGGVKRHGFHGGPKTHGQSDRHRAPGSIGQGTTPGRVYKGKKMAGHMGFETVTVKNLVVMDVTNDGVVLVSGLVPGPKNGILMINKVGAKKKFVPLLKEEKEAIEDVVEVKNQEDIKEPVISEEEAVEVKTEDDVKTSEDVQTEEDKVETAEEQVEASAEGEESVDSEVKEEKEDK